MIYSIHMFFNELPNNTSQQLPLIVVGFGFTPAESALFNIAKPLIGSFLVLVSAAMLYATRLGTGYTCAISYIPCFVGGIIEVGDPHHIDFLSYTDLDIARCTVVKQGCFGCWDANFHIQAVLPPEPVLGWHYNDRLHQEAHGSINLCRCCIRCQHDFSRVSQVLVLLPSQC
jgi:hypothetical protein